MNTPPGSRKREFKLNDISQAIAEIDSQYSSSSYFPLTKPHIYSQKLDLTFTTQGIRLASFYPSKLAKPNHLASFLRSIAKWVRLLDHLEINNTFKHFYSNLYSSECDNNCPQFNPFFNNLHFSSVPAEQNSLQGGAISNEEILKAINSLKCNKTPSPDGYSSESYKKFALKLCPLL